MRTIFKFLRKLKEKENLLHESKPVPETAKDVYGEVGVSVQSTPQSDNSKNDKEKPKELPGDSEKAPNKFVDKNLEDIRELDEEIAASKKQDSQASPVEVSVKEPGAMPGTELKNDDAEKANLDEEKHDKKPSDDEKSESKHHHERHSHKHEPGHSPGYRERSEGFFVDFGRFINNKGLDDKLLNNLLTKDLLHKMKEFHLHREEGVPFFFHAEDSDLEMAHKLEDLQRLEEEWYIRHQKFKEAEMLVLEKEAEIDLKLEELKTIMKHIKQMEKLETAAGKSNYFHLGDGRTLKSIGALREALKTMKDDLFEFHVNHEKNDFADWVDNVFNEKHLADMMRGARSSRDLLKLLYEF